jgi:5-methylthioadenosine/S-adenosylhomocysteine deaminase
MTPPDAAPRPCDLLIRARAAFLLDAAGTVLCDAAVAVVDDRIVAVGAAAEIEAAWAPARRLGSPRHLLMPGLVNTHNHTPLTIVRGMVEDLNFAPAYTPGIPQGDALSFAEAHALARLGVWELLRFGSTTIVDFYRHPEALARAAEEVGLRAFVGGRILDADTAALARGEWRADAARGRATFAEAMEVVERRRAPGSLVTPILGPHAPDTCSPDLLRQVATIAAEKDLILHTHLHQSPLEVAAVVARDGRRPVETLEALGLLGPRLVAGHCIHMTDGDIARFGRSGAHVAHVPIGNAAHGSVAPILALEAAGAGISLATDTKSGDMFEAMRMALAATRIRGGGFVKSAADMLGWATRGGARALGLADEIGAVAVGRKADLLLLDARAPNLAPLVDGPGLLVHSANGAVVDTVVVDGRVLLEGGRPTRFDGDEVIASAEAVARSLWRRHGHTPRIA